MPGGASPTGPADPSHPANPPIEPCSKALEEDLHRRFSAGGLRRQRWRRIYQSTTWRLLVQSARLIRRAFDFSVSAGVLLFAGTLLILPAHLTGATWRRTPRVGRWCEPFEQLSLVFPDGAFGRLFGMFGIGSLPALINVLRGEMSLVGPRAAAPGELSPQQRLARRRYDVRPGLISLWWVRQRANIAYGSEAEVDAEYIDSQSLRGDLGLLLRAMPAALYGGPAGSAADRVQMLGLRIDNLTMSECVETLLVMLDADTPSQVTFVNADCANLAFSNTEYRQALNGATLTLADGIGMKLAGKLLGSEVKQNVNGTDLFPRLCAALEGTRHGIFLLGARPGVAEAVGEWIREHYPGVTLSGVHDGYFTSEQEPDVIRRIADSGASLLLVAFGAPRQDLWVSRHLAETGVRVAMGVGGLFDFYSGRIPRAPVWMREIGMEWFYRFLQEPGRMWKRYFVGNAVFLFRVIKERAQGARAPG